MSKLKACVRDTIEYQIKKKNIEHFIIQLILFSEKN